MKYDSIWPDLDVSGKSALAGEIWCVFLGKKNGLNGTNKFIYLEGMVYAIRWLLQCIRIISTWWQLNVF